MPTLLVVAVLAPFLGFYVARVNGYRDFLHARGFRLLETASTQLESELEGMKSTVKAAHTVAEQFERRKQAKELGSGATQEGEVRAYLRKYLPDAEADSIEFRASGSGSHNDDRSLASLDARSPLKPPGLRLAFTHQGPGTAEDHLVLHVPFAKVTSRLLPGSSKEFFDLLVLATDEGTVLGSTGEAALRFSHLDALLKEAKAPEPPRGLPSLLSGANAGAGAGKKPLVSADVAKGQQRLTVQFSGDEYALFLEPLQIRLAVPDGKAAESKGQAVQLLVGGLVRVSVLEAKAMAMPTSDPVAAFLCLVSLLAITWPALKLATMSSKERLRPLSIGAMAVAALCAAAVLTQLYLAYGFHLTLRQETAANLRRLSERLRENFYLEIRDAVRMIEAARLEPKGKPAAHLETFRSIDSLSPATKRFPAYPFFAHLFSVEPENDKREAYQQDWKLSSDLLPTPLIPIRPASYPALGQLQRRELFLNPGDSAKALHIGLQTVRSTSTGEYLTLAAVEGDPGHRGDRYWMMSTRLISLTRPVMQAGYQFAVIDPEGNVKYHSDAFRSGRENFLRECTRAGELATLLRTGASGLLQLDYGGRSIRAYVSPLRERPKQAARLVPGEIPDLDWGLVIFRQADADRETVFQAGLILMSLVGTCVLVCLAVYFAIVLLPRVASPLARSLDSERRLWPRARDRGFYLLEIAILGGASLVLLAMTVVNWGDGFTNAAAVLLSLVWAGGAAVWFVALRRPDVTFWRGPVGRVKRMLAHVSLPAVFAWRWTALIFFFVVGGHLVAFQASLQVLQLLSEVRTHIDIVGQLQERRRATDASARATGLAEKTAKDFVEKRNRALYDLADARAHSSTWDVMVKPLAQRWNAWYAPPLLRLALPILGVTQEGWAPASEDLGGLLRTGEESLQYHWDYLPASASTEPRFRAWPVFPSREWEWHYLLLGVALAGAMYGWFHFVFQRLFVQNFEDPRWQAACSPDELAALVTSSRRLLVFTHPQANSTATVQGLAARLRDSGPLAVHLVDLASAHNGGEAAWAAVLAETRAKAAGNVLIVDNLEFRFTAESIRLRALQLLEEVSAANPGHVCVVSSVDPVLSLESAAAGDPALKQELARWIRALAGFDRISFDHPYDLQEERVRLASAPRNFYVDFLMIFNREFDRTYYLRTLVPRIMKDFDVARSPTPAHFEQFIVNRTLQLADGLYRMLWNTMTAEERMVLFQLAADGWVNPQNHIAVAHLVRRRLIFVSASAGALKERGAFEIMNESFRRFVLTAQDPAEVRSWESDDQNVLWRGMRLGLLAAMVLAAAWVSYIRRDLFDAYVGYIAAATGGSAAMLKWVVDIVRKPGGDKAGK